MQTAGPDTRIEEHTILVLVVTRAQFDVWDETFCIYNANPDPVLVIGCGRVGRAAIQHLTNRRIAYRVIDLQPERAPDPAFVVAGNATDRAECVRRVESETVSGSVAGGGVLRESVTTTVISQ